MILISLTRAANQQEINLAKKFNEALLKMGYDRKIERNDSKLYSVSYFNLSAK